MMQCNLSAHDRYDLSDVERLVATPTIDVSLFQGHESQVKIIDLGGGAFIMDMREFVARYPERAQQTFLAGEHRHKLEQQKFFTTTTTAAYDQYMEQSCMHASGEYQERSSIDADSSWQTYHRGYVLYVPAGVRLEKSVDLRCVGQYVDTLLHEQVVIIVEQGASVTVYDYGEQVQTACKEIACKWTECKGTECKRVDVSQYYRADRNASQRQSVGIDALQIDKALIVRSVSWWVGEGAQLTFIHDQQYANNVMVYTMFMSYGDASSIIDVYLMLLGASFSRTVLDIAVGGPNAQVMVRGVYALAGDQRAQIVSFQKHQIAGSSSSVHIKGLLAGSARAVFKGTIFIDEHASKTSARLENKNLLLSDQARVSSMPILQVLHNEVQCAHGSATSQLDLELLFYAHARGIDVSTAQRLLVEGFVADLLPAQYAESMLVSVNNKVI